MLVSTWWHRLYPVFYADLSSNPLHRLGIRGDRLDEGYALGIFFSTELQLVELRIETTQLQQLVMLAALDDDALIQYEDHVGSSNGGEPVRDNDGRLTLSAHQPVESVEYQFFRGRVQSGTRLIHNQNGRIANDRAGDGDALPLSAGKRCATLSHDGVISLRQLFNELVGIRQFGAAEDPAARYLLLPIAYVVPHP